MSRYKSGKTLNVEISRDISKAELTEKMKCGETLCSINFLIFPRITNSLYKRQKKKKICLQTFEEVNICRAMKHQGPRFAYCFELGSAIIFLATLEISSSHPVKITWPSTNG